MTAKEFVFELENYYELKYSKGVQNHLGLWLKAKNELFLSALFDEVIKTHSRRWKCLPDIAIFEECKAEAMEKAELERQRLKPPAPRIEPPFESEEMQKQAYKLLQEICDTMRGKMRALRE